MCRHAAGLQLQVMRCYRRCESSPCSDDTTVCFNEMCMSAGSTEPHRLIFTAMHSSYVCWGINYLKPLLVIVQEHATGGMVAKLRVTKA